MLSSYTLCDLEDQKKNCYVKKKKRKKEKGRQNKLHHFNWFNKEKKKKEKKMKPNCFDRFKLFKIDWLWFVVVIKTLYLVLIKFCNLAAECSLIPQLISRFSRLQASNEETNTWASPELSWHGSYPSHLAQIDKKSA